MRYGVDADYEHQTVLKTKVAQGFIQSGIVNKDELDKLHRKINATCDLQSQDLSDMKSLIASWESRRPRKKCTTTIKKYY